MKSLANKFTLIFSILLLAVFGFGQTEEHLQATFDPDLPKLTQSLKQAPDFAEKSLHLTAPAIELPMPDGTKKSFRMFKTHPMHPELAAKFPEIQTYHGKCYGDGISAISVTISPKGLSAMVLDDRFEEVFIEPEGESKPGRYVSFYAPEDALSNYMCPMGDDVSAESISPKPATSDLQAPVGPAKSMVNNANALGDKLRTHRFAVAATGEFTQAHGGTVASALADIVTMVNQINLLYIREFAINFQLVANNNLIIYTDPNTDPYVNDGNPSPDLQNNAINAVIGSANYDIGHLMQNPTSCPGCGGWAGPGPCVNGGKASGMSVYSFGVMRHEMGHQFNCPHTTDPGFPDRYDHPAIGNTIMGGNGPNTIFHINSAIRVAAWVEDPGYCVPGINTNNTIPLVSAGAGGMYIPKITPFQLSGSASDPDPNTTLLYTWHQYNNEMTYNVVNNRIVPVGNVPVFRCFNPTPTGNVRTIPRLEDILNNTYPFGLHDQNNMGGPDTLNWETLPNYSRSLTFRLVARDYEPTGGAFDYDELTFNVDGNSGPFVVTSPNTGNPTWTAGSSVTVTWNVANTNNAPVSCANVNIKLSTDGGYTYPYTLVANTPNDGTQTFTLPNTIPNTTTARVRVECATYTNVVFFDISNQDFTISSPCIAYAGFIPRPTGGAGAKGSPSLDLTLTPLYGNGSGTGTFDVPGTGSPAVFPLFNDPQTMCVQGCCALNYNTYEFQVDKAGTYTFDVAKTGGGLVFMSVLNTPYNTANVCTGFLTSNLKECCGGVGNTVPFEASLMPGVTYTLVFHPFFEPTVSGTMTFTNNFDGTAVVLGQGLPAPPASDYGYTYVAVNQATGLIAAVSQLADFTGLAAGSYRVFGLSYKSANPPPAIVNPATFVGQSMSAALASNCISFSKNYVNVTVTGGGGTPSLAIAATDANKAEGNAGPIAFTFIVTRTGNTANQSTANWAVTGSGANPANGADFTGANFPSGTVTFPAGSSANQTITVNVNGDTDVEPNEGFTVTLSNPVNATIAIPTANGSIQNDDAAPAYCTAGATNTGFEKISNVQFNTINNPSGSTAGYEDFTAVSTTVVQGSTHTFTGTISNPFASDEIIVWIDFNHDLDFDDPGEEVFNSPTGPGPHTGNITIPANAMTGSTRMRVRLHDTGDGPNPTPCGNSSYGQVEDYTITVNPVAVAAKTLDFDGTDDHVVLPANLPGTLNSFTFEAWVFWDGSNFWQRIMDFGLNTSVYMFLTPKGSPGDNPIFGITNSSSGGEQRIISNISAAIGQWQHYAVTLDDATNTGTMYIDGVQVGQNTNMTLTPMALGNLPNNYLGKSQWADPYFDGKMDEVRLWNYAKTASQVTCQKDFELTGAETGLVAYFNFNQGFANSSNPGVTTLDDLTANNNDGALTNFALTGTGSNWTEPGAPVQTTPYNCQSCIPYTATGTPINIPDLATITSTINVPVGGSLTDVNILNLNGTHTYIGDLTFTLTSPQNTSVVLIQNQCGGSANFSISLDDQAANPLSCPINAGNTQQPQNPLAAFNGQNPSGNWVLTITDGAGGDFGVLNGWTLEICGMLGGNCPSTLAVPGNIASGTYQASATLTSTGTVQNGSNVTFKAGTGITLEANFEVQLGGILTTVMEACMPYAPPAGISKKE